MSVERFKPQETQRRTVCLLKKKKKAQAVYNSVDLKKERRKCSSPLLDLW